MRRNLYKRFHPPRDGRVIHDAIMHYFDGRNNFPRSVVNCYLTSIVGTGNDGPS